MKFSGDIIDRNDMEFLFGLINEHTFSVLDKFMFESDAASFAKNYPSQKEGYAIIKTDGTIIWRSGQ